jgi:hypothetical protein
MTLRRLYQLDARNPVWPDDIRAFEVVRHRELSGEIEESISLGAFRRLSANWDEVHTTPWLAAPPSDLMSRLQGTFLRETGEELYRAYQAQDFARAQQLRDRWEQMNPRVAFPPSHPVWGRVNLCLDWVRREEQRQGRRMEFETALLELEQALGREMPPERLRRIWGQVADFRIRVPTAIEDRYTAKMEAFRRQADRKERLILAVAFGGGALLLVGFMLFAMLRH